MRMRIAILLGMTLLACSERPAADTESQTARTANDKFLGLVHGDLPAGIERKGWIYLDSIAGKDYALTVVSQGRRRMFWLDQSVQTDSARQWQVVAVLGVDSLGKNREMTVGGCSAPDLRPIEIVAQVTRPAPGAPVAVDQAWRVDRRAQKFVPLRVGSVVCK